MGIGPSRDVLWTHFRHRATQSLANPSHSEMNNHSFKKGMEILVACKRILISTF